MMQLTSLIPRPSHVSQRTWEKSEDIGMHDYWVTRACSLLKIKMSVYEQAACDCLPSPQLSYFIEALWKVEMKI